MLMLAGGTKMVAVTENLLHLVRAGRDEGQTKKTTGDRRRVEGCGLQLGCENQSTSQTNSDSTNDAKVGFLLHERARHIQFRTVRSTLPFSGIRYRARTAPSQNPEPWQTF